jgi:O-antigen/teichoic acid export membrane protein
MSSAALLVHQFKSRFKIPPLLRNLSITFSENVITKGLSFLSILILTRMLGPEDYGKYSFVFVTVALCSALFDFGMENTAVRFAARDKDKKQTIFGLYLSVKIFTLLALVLFFIFGGEWLFRLMDKAAVSQYMPFLIMGLIGESLFLVNDTYLQANQQFQLRAAINIARYTVALLYVIFLLSGNQVALQTVFYIYLVPLAFSLAFLGKYLGFIRTYIHKRMEKSLFKELCRYEQWMFVYSVAYNLLGRVDFFMLGFWVGFHELGIYNAAFQLCSIVSFLPMALGKVLLPALSELSEQEIFKKGRKLIRATNWMCLAASLPIPFLHWLVPLLLGKDYASAVPVLQILLFAFILSLMSMPYEQSLYSLGQPKILSVGRYLQLLLIVLLNLVMLPVMGAEYGIYIVALTGLAGRVMYLVFSRYYYLQYESRVLRHQSEVTVSGVF